MATNWKTPVGLDLQKVLNLRVFKDANQNLGNDVSDNTTYDPDLPNRADELVSEAVDTIRAAIQNSGSVPLSVTQASVPPEGLRHALNLAAYQMIVSTPNLKMIIMTENGSSNPFLQFHRDALDWVEAINLGRAVTPPTDPCGADWVNPIGTQLNAVPSSAVYDGLGQYLLTVTPGYEYTWNAGANDTGVQAFGTTLASTTGSTFVPKVSQIVLKGTPSLPVTAQLIFDNPPVSGMVRFGGTTAAAPVDLTTTDAPFPPLFDTADLGQP